MENFFRFCADCKMTFTSKANWDSHVAEKHSKTKKHIPAPMPETEVSKNKKLEDDVQTASAEDDTRLAATYDLRHIKKVLRLSGVEYTNTMSKDEAIAKYQELKESGKVVEE